MNSETYPLRAALRDIKRGFSEIKISENSFCLKHLAFDDQIDIDEVYDKYYKEGLERGLPIHDEVLKNLIEEKQWSQEMERKIFEYEKFIENLEKQKKSSFLKTEIQRINSDIADGRKKLNDLKNNRAQLFSKTAEFYAEERVGDFYILKCLYVDEKMSTLVYTEEQFAEVDQQTVLEIISEYNKVYHKINDEVIQKIVLSDFYNLYMPFAENAMEFYGIPICSLTYNQLKLLLYSRFFRNIFQQHDKMPNEIRKDPEKIMDYVNANENAKKLMDKRNSKEGEAQSIVGATKEDLEYLGMKAKSEKTLSISEEAKKKGGSLNMEDMMKIFGV